MVIHVICELVVHLCNENRILLVNTTVIPVICVISAIPVINFLHNFIVSIINENMIMLVKTIVIPVYMSFLPYLS